MWIVGMECVAMRIQLVNSDLTSLLIVPEGQSFKNPLYLCTVMKPSGINVLLQNIKLCHWTHHLVSSLGETVNNI